MALHAGGSEDTLYTEKWGNKWRQKDPAVIVQKAVMKNTLLLPFHCKRLYIFYCFSQFELHFLLSETGINTHLFWVYNNPI